MLVCEKVQNICVDVQQCVSVSQSTAIGDAQYQSSSMKEHLQESAIQREVVWKIYNICIVHLEAGVVVYFARSALLHMPLASDSLDARA